MRRASENAKGAVSRAAGSLAQSRFGAVLVLLVLLFAFFAITEPAFLTAENVRILVAGAAILWLVSMGLTFVLLSGGFDLSLGSLLALSGVAFGALYLDLGLPAMIAVLCTIGFGFLAGAGVNGILIGRYGLSFLVVTLGTLILYRGLVNLWTDTETRAVTSTFLDDVAFSNFAGLPIPVWIMIGTFIAALYVQRNTYFGRDVFAVGGNSSAAGLAGIRVPRTLAAVYGIAGGLAAAGGVLQVARIGAVSPTVGETIIFDAAAAVLIGGTSFEGGVGGVAGTAVGVLLLATLQNGLGVAGVEAAWQQVISGGILVLAVAVDSFRRSGRPWRRRVREWQQGAPEGGDRAPPSEDG